LIFNVDKSPGATDLAGFDIDGDQNDVADKEDLNMASFPSWIEKNDGGYTMGLHLVNGKRKQERENKEFRVFVFFFIVVFFCNVLPLVFL
jgi:hypothetical protein